jgi:hypothetical protein
MPGSRKKRLDFIICQGRGRFVESDDGRVPVYRLMISTICWLATLYSLTFCRASILIPNVSMSFGLAFRLLMLIIPRIVVGSPS